MIIIISIVIINANNDNDNNNSNNHEYYHNNHHDNLGASQGPPVPPALRVRGAVEDRRRESRVVVIPFCKVLLLL